MSNEQLVLRIKAGEDVANNMLQLYHQMEKAIAKIAYNYRNLAELEDLQQEGYIGLCKAVDAYKPESGIPFINYAWKRIEWHISRYIAENNPLHIPAHMYDSIRKYKRFFRDFLTEHHRNPSEAEICHFMKLDTEQVALLLKCVKMEQIESIYKETGDGEDFNLADNIPSNADVEGDVLEDSCKEQMKREIWEMVDELPPEQAQVIRLRYQRNKLRKDICKDLDMTEHRVKTAEEKGFRTLRNEPQYRNRLLSFLYPEDEAIYTSALHGNGVGTFKRTWTSSTERTAMQRIERY